MPFRAEDPTFAGGEIGDELAARIDTAKYRTALKRSRNMIGLAAGGVVNRQGFEFVGEIYDSTSLCKLIPFSFSIDQTYVLPFEDETSRVVSNGGFVLEPYLVISGITNASPAVVTCNAHGYAIGDDVFFDNVQGMVEINRLTGRVIAVGDANTYTIDIDTTLFGAFTGDVGGIAGDAHGGVGGGDPDVPPPDTVPPTSSVPPPATTPPPPDVFKAQIQADILANIQFLLQLHPPGPF